MKLNELLDHVDEICADAGEWIDSYDGCGYTPGSLKEVRNRAAYFKAIANSITETADTYEMENKTK